MTTSPAPYPGDPGGAFRPISQQFLLISTLQKWLSSCERAPSFRRARKLPGLSIDTSLFSVRLRSRKGPCAKNRAVKIRHKIFEI